VLNLIVERYARRVVDLGLEEPVAEPASQDDLRRVQADTRELLGADLDPAYLYLAGIADGIGADGSGIYSTRRRRVQAPATDEIWYTKWIIQENLDWRKEGGTGSEPHDWLIYGMGEMEFIIQHLPSRRFQLRARSGWSLVIGDFATFEELVWDVFRYSLELGDFPAESATETNARP
jgi:hypothetical protein